MMLNDKQRIVLETNAARDRAEALLQGLLEAKAETERQLTSLRRSDVFKTVTGRSSLENAISSTRGMIESLNAALDRARTEAQDVAIVGAALATASA